MQEYGGFAETIARMDDDLAALLSVWSDQTAPSYEAFHDNVEAFCQLINFHLNEAKKGAEVVKANYDESALNDAIRQASLQLEALV